MFPDEVPYSIAAPWGNSSTDASVTGQGLRDIEAEVINKAIVQARGNVAQAARALGISRATLWRRMREAGLTARR